MIESQRILLRSVSRSLRRYATPRATIEAIMHSVRVRGTGALHEPANIERLSRCDDAVIAEIDARIKKIED